MWDAYCVSDHDVPYRVLLIPQIFYCSFKKLLWKSYARYEMEVTSFTNITMIIMTFKLIIGVGNERRKTYKTIKRKPVEIEEKGKKSY